MEKLKLNPLIIIIFLFLVVSSCKKEEKLQPTGPFCSKFLVLTDLERTHYANQHHIKIGRTTTDSYDWDGEVIVINGPAGYHDLYHKAAREFGKTYQNEVMLDTTELCVGCMQEQIIRKYLELKWENEEKKAFKKMRLAVPKNLYEVYPRFFELFLTAQMDYLTKEIGGKPGWYSGKRSLEKEKEIMKLFYKEDTDYQDPWACNCNPHTYVLDYYKNYVQGNNKKSLVNQNLKELPDLQESFAVQRHNNMSTKYGGEIKNYSTQYDPNEGEYFLEIPAYWECIELYSIIKMAQVLLSHFC